MLIEPYENGLGVVCYYDIAYDNIGFSIERREGRGGPRFKVKPLEFEEVNPRLYTYEPTFRLEQPAAQLLFNHLWRCGFRPKDGTGNSGHVEAMRYHLEDMRKLVFKGEK